MATSFGALLWAHRRAAGLTQEGLAQRAAISGQAVGALERGDRRFPHRDTIDRLAAALGLTPEQRNAFAAAAGRRPAPRPENPAPHQLPAPPTAFVGRVEAMKVLDDLTGSAAGPVVATVCGMAGVGKSAFAVHWAHQVRDRFPDGQLYLNLRGYCPLCTPMEAGYAVRVVLEALDMAPHRIPATIDAQVGLYRSMLGNRRRLILLDNAANAEQVRPLLPSTGASLVLVTSRDQLTSLVVAHGAHPVRLDVLTADEAEDLLVARLGAQRLQAERNAAAAVIDLCGRLPLALSIVAARAKAHPDFLLSTFADELRGGLDALSGADPMTSLRRVFAPSYRDLSADAARLFRLLRVHPGPDISSRAARSLLGAPVHEPIAELVRVNLLIEHAPGRYTMHDLSRAFSAEQPETDRAAGAQRMLDHYLHTALAAQRFLAPTRDLVQPGPIQPGTEPEPVQAHEALAWFIAEHAVLLAMTEYAAANGWDDHAWRLAAAFSDYLHRGYWHDAITVYRTALAAVVRLGDPTAAALVRDLLATATAGRADAELPPNTPDAAAAAG
jgi:transcriptional regulator with XRE-family HTH domain